MKRHFDALIVVPLAEEFEAILDHFVVSEDLTAGEQIRLAAKVPGTNIDTLLVQQGDMGKPKIFGPAHQHWKTIPSE
jgi:hypothetical protein